MLRRFSLFVIALCLTAFASLTQEQSITPKHSRHFTRYEGCEFVPTKYADGDSFKVRIKPMAAPTTSRSVPDATPSDAVKESFAAQVEFTIDECGRSAEGVIEFIHGQRLVLHMKYPVKAMKENLPEALLN